jgi:prephenate dehydrogenase
MPHLAVVGTGLIGTSVALGLAEAGWTVAGWDPDPVVREKAAARFNSISDSLEDLVDGADLVVVASPPAVVPEVLAGIETAALVTDVAGVKAGIIDGAAHLDRFVSGHPMAGREVSGPEAASAALFRGATWIVITDGASDDDMDELERVVAQLGAVPVRMTAADHDDAVAMVSQLPQVLASALVREATEHPAALGLASGSFRDLTRVAASDPGLWTELLMRNGGPLAEVIEAFAARLGHWAAAIRSANEDDVRAALASASETRRGMAPPVVAVGVALADRPGELARVGRALEASKVDVRDLQLRHATYGGGGILTLSVRPGEAEPLRAALVNEGLLLE